MAMLAAIYSRDLVFKLDISAHGWKTIASIKDLEAGENLTIDYEYLFMHSDGALDAVGPVGQIYGSFF